MTTLSEKIKYWRGELAGVWKIYENRLTIDAIDRFISDLEELQKEYTVTPLQDEEIEKLAKKEFPINRPGDIVLNSYDESQIIKRRIWVDGYKAALSAPKEQKRLQWVKCNERTPDENGSYFCKCKNKWSEWIGAYIEFYEGDWQDNHPAPTGVIEWLEEPKEDTNINPLK